MENTTTEESVPTKSEQAYFRSGYKSGLLKAAEEVESHWSYHLTQCNQKDQAKRSADVLRALAAEVK